MNKQMLNYLESCAARNTERLGWGSGLLRKEACGCWECVEAVDSAHSIGEGGGIKGWVMGFGEPEKYER